MRLAGCGIRPRIQPLLHGELDGQAAHCKCVANGFDSRTVVRMVHTPDPELNLRADIKATMVAMESYIQMGGYRRAAASARELADKLERLASIEMPNDGPRHRRIEPPPPPDDGDEFLGPRLAAMRRAARTAGMPVPPRRSRQPAPHHIEVTEVKREPPALPEG